MIRKQKGQTQGDFATLCGISQTYLSQVENNLKEPHLSTLKSISEQLNVPLPILLYLSMTKEDVQPNKLEAFDRMNSSIKSLINEIFDLQKYST